MAWCDKQFEQWNEDLKLTAEQVGRITSAFDHFNNFCSQFDDVKRVLAGKPFYQGSAATRTIIRPLADREFDVDIVFPFSLAESRKQDSRSVMDWFKSQISEDDFYKKNRIEKDRCVRIDYAGEFHVDFIPATQDLEDQQPYAIPAKDLAAWYETDPIGFKDWVMRVDSNSSFFDKCGDGAFVRAIRYLKRWRDHTFDNPKKAPSSMLLVTMLGRHDPANRNYLPPLENPLYPEYKHDVVYVYDMLRLTHSCLALDRKTSCTNPTNGHEDLGSDWANPDRDTFISELGNVIEKLHQGIYSASESEAKRLFREALGESFPN